MLDITGNSEYVYAISRTKHEIKGVYSLNISFRYKNPYNRLLGLDEHFSQLVVTYPSALSLMEINDIYLYVWFVNRKMNSM